MKRKIAAILAADVAHYSRMVAQDEEGTLARLAAYREVFDSFVAKGGGRIFNTAGDSVMCAFESAVEAVRAAIDIQESLRTRNRGLPLDERLMFRIGISIGDVVERGGDLLGDGVNVAARLEGIAEPGGICISRSVYEAVANKVAVRFHDLGAREVKNIPNPIHAYVVSLAGDEARLDRATRSPRWLPALGGITALALIGGGVLVLSRLGLPAPPIGPATPPVVATTQPTQSPPEAPSSRPEAPSVAPLPPTGGNTAANPGPVAPAKVDPPKTEPSKSEPSRSEPSRTEQAQAEPPKPEPPRSEPVKAESRPPEATKTAEAPPRPALPADPAAAYAVLSERGGIIAAPSTPAEFYHNARSFEARGDTVAARRAFVALARQRLAYIDPLLRFAALLRAQEGRAGARETFGDMMRDGATAALATVHAMQFDGAERRAKLDLVARSNPDFAPVHYLLADEYGEDRLGEQPTVAERRLRLAALNSFLGADQAGALNGFFLDQSLLAQWLDLARRDREALTTALAKVGVRASYMRSNAGWTVSLALPEPASLVEYRTAAHLPLKPTGFLSVTDPRTGKPMPNPSFELPPDQGPADLTVRYRDLRGLDSGETLIRFDPREALLAGQREILERTTTAWLAFGNGNGYLYYTHLMSYRCAIAKAAIGFDGAAPDRELAMPPCNDRDPYAIPHAANPYLRIPAEVRSVTAQLVYADGSRSDVMTFRRP